jgi:hypothetical protein
MRGCSETDQKDGIDEPDFHKLSSLNIEQIIKQRKRKIIGLYVGQYPGNLHEIKFGKSDCLQNRTHDSAYTTAVYDPFNFVYFVHNEQNSEKNSKNETRILNFLQTKLGPSIKRKEGGEAFKSFQGPININDIAKIIKNKLGNEYFLYNGVIPKDCQIRENIELKYSGPYTANEKYKCHKCGQERYRTSYYIAMIDGKEEKIGGDCMEKLRLMGYRHENETMEFYQSLEGIPECDLGLSSEISVDETCRRHMTRILTTDISSETLKRYGTQSTDLVYVLYHKHVVLALNYFYEKSKIRSVSLAEITDYYEKFEIQMFPNILEYVINNMDQEIFALDKSGNISCLYLKSILDGLPEKIHLIRDNIDQSIPFILDDISDKVDDRLNTAQLKAIDEFGENRMGLLVGGGGTGKGSVITVIYRASIENNIPCYITSTGSLVVADNQKRCGGESEHFQNMNKILVGPDIKRPSILIVDEFFFTDPIKLFFLLDKFEALCGLLLVGDLNQIRPIHFPDYWFEFIKIAQIPDNYLFKNHRQSDGLRKFSEPFATFPYDPEHPLKRRNVRINRDEIIRASHTNVFIKSPNDVTGYLNIMIEERKTQFIASTNEECKSLNDKAHDLIIEDMDHKCTEEWQDKQNRFYCRHCIGQFLFIVSKNIKSRDLKCLNNADRENVDKLGLYNGRMIHLCRDCTDEYTRIRIEHNSEETSFLKTYLNIEKIDVEGKKPVKQIENFKFIGILLKYCDLRYCLTPEKFQGKQEDNVIVIWNNWLIKDPYKFYSVITRPKFELTFIISPDDPSGTVEKDKKSIISRKNGNLLITFGDKHKGDTFDHVFDTDKKYVNWALTLDKPGASLKSFISYCREHQSDDKE